MEIRRHFYSDLTRFRLQIAFYIEAAMPALAAIFSALRGEKYIPESHHEK